MNKLSRLRVWAESNRELWLDCVRIYLGIGLFVRGWLILNNRESTDFIDQLQQAKMPWVMTGAVLHYVALGHFIGGIMLTAGFLTRLAAVIQVPILFGAVIVHRHEGFLAMRQSLEFSVLVLFLLVIIFINGAGRLSLDYATFGRRAAAPPGEPLATH